MKTIIFLILIGVAGCFYYPEDGTIPCGYEETPYAHMPYQCSTDSWSNGECCTWIVEDFYGECVETWCYEEYFCGWNINQYACYPI